MGSVDRHGGAPFVGIVCGLASEAASIRRGLASAGASAAFAIAVSGADADRASELSRKFCTDGARLLVSAGMAGGLGPALRAGDIVWATQVVDCVTAQRTETAWSVTEPAAHRRAGAVAGVDTALATREAKRLAFQRTGALAVDMETHRVARAASAARVPLLVVRSIVDDAGTSLPDLVNGSITPEGRPRTGALIAGLAMQPWQLPALIGLARSSARALKSLEDEMPTLARAADALLAGG